LVSADTDELEVVENFEQPDIEGVPSYGAAAFHKDSDELREAYNDMLSELKDDGTIDELLEKNDEREEMNMDAEDVATESKYNDETIGELIKKNGMIVEINNDTKEVTNEKICNVEIK